MSERLVEAARNGSVEAVASLITAKWWRRPDDVNSIGGRGETPLHAASEKGHFEVARLLIERGANSNAVDKVGATPLFNACANDHVRIAELLLTNRADPDGGAGLSRDVGWQSGARPLHAVAWTDAYKVAELLLKRGAHWRIQDAAGLSPLHVAAKLGAIRVLNILLDAGADIEQNDRYGSTPLYEAVSSGHIAIVEALIAKGANVNAPAGGNSPTPLHHAASRGNAPILKLLLRSGADCDLKTKDGNLPDAYAETELLRDILLKHRYTRATGNPASIPEILVDLETNRLGMMGRAIQQLCAIGKPALPALLKLLDEGREWLYWPAAPGLAARALGAIGDTIAIPVLLNALTRQTSWCRVEVAKALAKLGEPSGLDAMRSMARDERNELRQVAAYARSELELLQQSLNEHSVSIQTSADYRLKSAVVRLFDIRDRIRTIPRDYHQNETFSQEAVETVNDRWNTFCYILDDDIYALSGVERGSKQPVPFRSAIERLTKTIGVLKQPENELFLTTIISKEGTTKLSEYLDHMTNIVNDL